MKRATHRKSSINSPKHHLASDIVEAAHRIVILERRERDKVCFTTGTAYYLEMVTRLQYWEPAVSLVDRQRLEFGVGKAARICRVKYQTEKELQRNLQRDTLKYLAEC